MQNDMLKLNQLLNKEGKLKDGLQQDNILMENDFVTGLKVNKAILAMAGDKIYLHNS